MEEFENENQTNDNSFDANEMNLADETLNNGFSKTEESIQVEVNTSKKTNWKKEVLDWTFSIVVAIAIALLIRNYVFTLVNVDGTSMTPTLSHGDKLYVNRFMYKPEIGDIIILHPPQSYNTPYVKRIIAKEGQIVDINALEGTVYVDGEKLDENYVTGPLSSSGKLIYPYKVPEDNVFVMGDNRNPGGSTDSRILGPIPVENIMGKAVFRILPMNNFGSLYK